MKRIFQYFFFFFVCFSYLFSKVTVGLDVFFEEDFYLSLKGKRIGLVTNHTGVDKNLKPILQKFQEIKGIYSVEAIFTPEHGFDGSSYAWEKISHQKKKGRLPIYSLYGKTRRPTDEMLKNIDVLIYDMQCIGARSYTYTTTLFYVMEEAAKKKIQVIVLDRPNPINGITVDGPFMEQEWRSYIGYVNVPYCHGMTIGELASFFNKEYKIHCHLHVIPMRGWHRSMSYLDTGLHWIPPSPHVPEPDTPYYYPTTGIIGELKILNIGVGYTLPFKVVGAPWINKKEFAEKLTAQNLPGVAFTPFTFRPFYGLYKGKDCHGIKILITDKKKYRPVSVQFLILGILKSLYPKQFLKSLDNSSESSKKLFCKALGSKKILNILQKEKYVTWKLLEFQSKERKEFLKKRKKYLLKDYPL